VPQPQIIVTPQSSTEELAEAVLEIQRILTGRVGLGDPGEGAAVARRTIGGTNTRPPQSAGRGDNILGSMVEVTLTVPTDLNVNLVVQHNLNLPAPASNAGRDQRLNVRWVVCGARYQNDNYAANLLGVGNSFAVLYADGEVTANSIDLRFYTTLSSLGNPELIITLFMMPASQ
jgi:hypothetical protein